MAFKRNNPDRVGSVSCPQGRPQATHEDTESQRMMTENQIGKIVVGLYTSHEVPRTEDAEDKHKNTKGKNNYLLFYFFNFVFLVISVSLCEN